MSTERTIRAQARVKIKKRGIAKPVFGFAVIMIFYMLAEYATYLLFTIAQVTLNLSDEITSGYLFYGGVALFNTLLLILFSPVVLGFIKMMCTEENDFDLMDVFFFINNIKRYVKALSFVFSFILRTIIPFVLFFAPLIVWILFNICFDVMTFIPTQWLYDFVYNITYVILFVISTLLCVIYSTKYFIAVKFLSEDQTMKTGHYFSISKKIMRGNCFNVVKLFFSFTPWFLLCITVLPILYVLPYFSQAMCLSRKWILELSRNGQE